MTQRIWSALFGKRRDCHADNEALNRCSIALPGRIPHESKQTALAPVRRGPHIAVLVADADAVVTPVTGWVVDRSVAGLWLELEEEGDVDPGTTLSVKVAKAAPGIPWVRVKVTQRCRLKIGWELKCEYVRVPPWSIRMLFG